MKVFRAAIIVALLVGPAYGQDSHVQRYGEPDKDKSPSQIAADKAAQRAYKESLSNIPDAAPVDPWGGARATGAPKEAVKPAVRKTAIKAAPAKQAKTGSPPN